MTEFLNQIGAFGFAAASLAVALVCVMLNNRLLRKQMKADRWKVDPRPRSRQHPETGGSGKPAKPPKR